jgi:hypothetical protein
MTELSPEATLLISKYTPGEIAEQVVELEEALDYANMTLAGCIQDNKTWFAKSERFEADLKERTDQYHLAHAKILSREAIIEDLGKDYNALIVFIVPFVEVAKETLKWVHDNEHNEFERKVIKAWQELSPELQKAIENKV